MKILMLTLNPLPPTKPYADSTRFGHIADILLEENHEVIFACPSSNGQKRKYKNQKPYFFSFKILPIIGFFTLPLSVGFQIFKIIAKTNPDIIYSNSVIFAFGLKRIRPNIKIYVDVMGLEFLEIKSANNSVMNRLRSIIIRMITKKYYSNADYITTVNNAHAKFIKKLTNIPVTVIRDYVDEDLFMNQKNPISLPLQITFIGGIIYKRLDELFEALEDIKSQENFIVNIVGEGPDLVFYKKVVEKSEYLKKRVRFLGYVNHDQIPKIIRSSLICYSDDWSTIGFPLKVFEYMAMGKCVVCKETVATKEVIKHNINGFLYKNGKHLKKIFLSLLNNPDLCKKSGQRAAKDYQAGYSKKIAEKQLLAVINALKK